MNVEIAVSIKSGTSSRKPIQNTIPKASSRVLMNPMMPPAIFAGGTLHTVLSASFNCRFL